MGQQASSTPTNEFLPENRMPPTWGSNLLVVNERSNNTSNSEIMSTVNNIGLCQNVGEVERFVEDFQKGAMGTNPGQNIQNDIVEGISEDESVEEIEEEENLSEDTLLSTEVKDDSHVVNYLKQLEEYKARQRSRRAALEGSNSLPAQAGIPVTTPKSSPSPKRSEKVNNNDEYSEDSEEFTFEGPTDEKVEEKSDEKEPVVEDSDEEYREWEKRLKHVQGVLEQNLKLLNLQKMNNVQAPESEE